MSIGSTVGLSVLLCEPLLLRDPLDFALVRRDQAMEALISQRKRSADLTAAALFDQARTAAHDCGSFATEAKALAGLVASGVDPDRHLLELAEVTEMIEMRRPLGKLP